MTILWHGSITIRDAKNQFSVLGVYLNTPDVITEEAADPGEFMQAVAAALDDLIDGQVMDIGLRRLVTLPAGLKAAPVPTADAEEGAVFYWRTALNTTVQTRFPTWREDLVLPDGSVNITPSVADFSMLFTQPEELPANWQVDPCDSRGASITSRERALENFKRSRPQKA